MTDTALRPYLTILQACALAGVSRRTIYNWIGAGKITYKRTAGGSVRIDRDSLFTTGVPRPRPTAATPQGTCGQCGVRLVTAVIARGVCGACADGPAAR